MLNRIKIILQIKDNSKDELLNELLKQAEQEVLNYTSREILPTQLENTIIKIVAINFNKLGSQGVKSLNIGDINYDFTDDELPKGIKSQLNKYRKARVPGMSR